MSKVAAPYMGERNADEAFAKQAKMNDLCIQLMDLIRITSLQELATRNADGKPLSNTAARIVAAGYRQIAKDLEREADEDDRHGRNW